MPSRRFKLRNLLAVILGMLVFSRCASPPDATGPSAEVSAVPSVVVLAAGDIASCDSDKGDSLTAALIQTMPDATVLTIGDNAYEDGLLSEYQNCYEKYWGKFKNRTRPSLGNHEYNSGNANGSFQYFGSAAFKGNVPGGYYSFDVGAWHIIMLNDNNSFVSIGTTSAQVQWLRQDLAATTQPCIMAVWHQPLFYSTNSGSPGLLSSRKNLWGPLLDAGADIVLNAHRHIYERFAPQDTAARRTSAGIRQFQVGTGGDNTGLKPTVLSPNSEVQHGGTNQFGVMKFTLHDGSYDWQYIPVGNNTFTDRGSATCHGSTTPPPPGAATMSRHAGEGQSAAAGTVVPTAPAVKVLDGNGAPKAGVQVTFAVQSGGGSVTGGVRTTDAAGVATVGAWTLGQTAGTNTLSAAAADVSGSPLVFTATGRPGPATAAATTATVPGGLVGAPTSILVTAKDQYGNRLTTGGATVTVTVTGANSVTPAVDDRGDGTYAATYTPTTGGTDQVAIRLGGVAISGSPYQSLVSTGGAPQFMAKYAGNWEEAPRGSLLPPEITPAVRVTDAAGLPVAGVTVSWFVIEGSPTITGTVGTTDANGIARVGSMTLGPVAGRNKVRARMATGTVRAQDITVFGF